MHLISPHLNTSFPIIPLLIYLRCGLELATYLSFVLSFVAIHDRYLFHYVQSKVSAYSSVKSRPFLENLREYI